MKYAIAIMLAFLLPGCAASRIDDVLRDVPAVETFVAPHPQRVVLSNGIEVLFIEDPELPIVRGTLYIPVGEVPYAERVALSGLGGLMGAAGAGDFDADSLDYELEKLSASVSVAFGLEYGSATIGCLSSDLDRAVALFSDVLLRPRFQEDRISLWKGQVLERIRRRGDSPETIAALSHNRLVYGNSPLGEISLPADVQAIALPSLRDLHSHVVRPDGAIFAVSGAVKLEHLLPLLEKHLGALSFPRKGNVARTLADLAITSEPAGIYFIRKPFTQASVLVGQIGAPRLSDDYHAIDGFNAIFGSDGSFSSQLVKYVRSELGLVYSVSGGIFPAMPLGKNVIALQTKSESTGEALNAALTALAKIRGGAIDEDELLDAKRSIKSSYIFKFDTTDNLVQRTALLSLLNYPESYDDTYTARIDALTREDVYRAALRWWDPHRLIVLVVGDDAALQSLKNGILEGPDYLKALPLREAEFNQTLELPVQ